MITMSSLSLWLKFNNNSREKGAIWLQHLFKYDYINCISYSVLNMRSVYYIPYIYYIYCMQTNCFRF